MWPQNALDICQDFDSFAEKKGISKNTLFFMLTDEHSSNLQLITRFFLFNVKSFP